MWKTSAESAISNALSDMNGAYFVINYCKDFTMCKIGKKTMHFAFDPFTSTEKLIHYPIKDKFIFYWIVRKQFVLMLVKL
jgi:hypothetical protein